MTIFIVKIYASAYMRRKEAYMLKFKFGQCNVKVSGITYISGLTGTGKSTTLLDLAMQSLKKYTPGQGKTGMFCEFAGLLKTSDILLLSGGMSDEIVDNAVTSLLTDERIPKAVFIDHAEYLKEERPDIYAKLIEVSKRTNLVLGGFQCFDLTQLKEGDCYIKTGIGVYRNKRYVTRTLVYPDITSHCVEIVTPISESNYFTAKEVRKAICHDKEGTDTEGES